MTPQKPSLLLGFASPERSFGTGSIFVSQGTRDNNNFLLLLIWETELLGAKTLSVAKRQREVFSQGTSQGQSPK